LQANNYITASCMISDHVVYKDEKPVFKDSHAGMPGFLLSIYNHFGIKYPKFYKMDNLGKLGLLTSEILLKDGFRPEDYKPGEIGVVLSNASSSLDTDFKYFETTKTIASPSLFVYTLPNIVIGEICIKNHFKGENAFFVFEQFDANFTEQYVSSLVNNNILQACICGWVELLEENYKAVLFLVEKKGTSQSIPFTTKNILKIYQADNGYTNGRSEKADH
jgi:hypothetical protein